jgi:hypothetical protein
LDRHGLVAYCNLLRMDSVIFHHFVPLRIALTIVAIRLPVAFSENDRKEMSQVSDAMEELLTKIDSSGHPALVKASVQMGDAIHNIRSYLREKKLEEKQKKTGKKVSLTAFFRPKP